MNITIVAGARPNFIKIAPIIKAIQALQKLPDGQIDYCLVHTGQHYDDKMSDTFFKQLEIPAPNINLKSGGGSQAEQTATIMISFEKYLINNPTDIVLVVGDVTSTMACSIVAKKLNTKVAHVEAGIRSFDLTMPEEINRMVTDSITDYFFTTSEYANINLRNSGVPESSIFFVGNVMIDTLLSNISKLIKPDFYDKLRLEHNKYIVLTMHRPSNVDEEDKLRLLLLEIADNVKNIPIIFPIHPRTANVLSGRFDLMSNIHVVDPLGYLEFNYLVKNSFAVITDSGGITEEATVMGVPCITLRNNTERPETVFLGTNELVGTDSNDINNALNKLINGNWKKGSIPDKWDGKAAERIVNELIKIQKTHIQ